VADITGDGRADMVGSAAAVEANQIAAGGSPSSRLDRTIPELKSVLV
jgi:hypothetical protein